jgi:hypothetical protein
MDSVRGEEAAECADEEPSERGVARDRERWWWWWGMCVYVNGERERERERERNRVSNVSCCSYETPLHMTHLRERERAR